MFISLRLQPQESLLPSSEQTLPHAVARKERESCSRSALHFGKTESNKPLPGLMHSHPSGQGF